MSISINPAKFPYTVAARIIGIITTIAGLVVLLGWHMNLPSLETFRLGTVVMKPNLGLLFFLGGIELTLLQSARKPVKLISQALSLVIILIALLTFLEFAFSLDLGIDQLFFQVKSFNPQLTYPARMAANAALNFLLLGLVFFHMSTRKNLNLTFIEIPVVVVFTISAIGLTIFTFGFKPISDTTGYYRLATNATILFIMLSFGILFTVRKHHKEKISMQQKFLAGTTVIAVLIGFISVFSISNIKSWQNTLNLRQGHQRLKDVVSNLNDNVMQIETGTSGYLLTGDTAYLSQIVTVRKAIPELLRELNNLSSVSPFNKEKLEKLILSLQEQLNYAGKVASLENAKIFNKKEAISQYRQLEFLSKNFQTLLQQVLDNENQQINQQHILLDKHSAQVSFFTKTGLLFLAILLVLLYFFIINDVTKRKKAEQDLLKLNEDLEAQVKRRTEALQNSREQYKLMIESVRDYAIFMMDTEGYIKQWNSGAEQIYGYTNEEITGKHFSIFFSPEDNQSGMPDAEIQNARTQGQFEQERLRVRKDGSQFWADGVVTAIYDYEGTLKGFSKVTRDITERKKAENRKRRQSEILESIAMNLPHSKILERIVKLVEEEDPTSLCSILLLDAEGKHLLMGAAPNLPEFYNEAIHGLEIGEKVGSCGAAAWSKQRVIAEDLITHPNWESFLELTTRAELRSCWSEPIFDSDGNVLGTFAIYHREPRVPTNEEIELLKSVVYLASVAITRKRTEEKLRNMNAELELKVEQRTELLAETNEKLREEEAKFRLVVESAPNAIIMVNSKGIIQMVNLQAESYFGYSRNEMIDNSVEMLVPDSAKIGHISERLNYMSHPKTRNIGDGLDLSGRKKDGTVFPIDVALSPIQLNNETSVLASIIDISKRKAIEDEIKNAKVEADRANLAKSEFLSRMSHELRTPMNSILGFAQLMKMGELSPSHKKGVEHILKNGKHLLELINEVLDLSRIESGKLSISLEPIYLAGIVSETLDIVLPLADQHKIQLKFDDCSNKNIYVKADQQKMKQVLLNLLNNAVKYNRENGSVKIGCYVVDGKPETESQETDGQEQKMVRISITDTGKGIAPEDLKTLFDPFQRIGAGVTEIEGTGLGLTVAKKLVEAMGGTIGVESRPETGSTFWIELPKAKHQLENYERLNKVQKTELKKDNVDGILLYIEDNVSNTQLIEQIIESHRPSIHLISDMYGRNAVKLARDYKPALILLDLDLPDIKGSEVLQMLQNNDETKFIPVVILSADAMPKQIDRLLKSGAKNYLTKPLDVVEFLKVLDEFMNREK
ncbi:MAG: PAS domain S-box protein [Bacteroidales bacterium]|nr:PAS domain S-box protein [Bacteroidales bacterium]